MKSRASRHNWRAAGFTMFSDLDAPNRNGAAQEPVIVAPATRCFDPLHSPVPARTAAGCRRLSSRNTAPPEPVIHSRQLVVAGRLGSRALEPVASRRAVGARDRAIVQQHRPGNTTTTTAFGVCAGLVFPLSPARGSGLLTTPRPGSGRRPGLYRSASVASTRPTRWR
jgi:hypothetical protein